MNKLFIALFIAIFAALSSNAQKKMNKPVPMDPNIRYGVLDNGITYYVRHNENPKKKASFYIVQNVGALMEEDNQDGLAHFLEHMAFNGTKNFPKKGIINMLERNGATFGSNINAYTARNETVYSLKDISVDNENYVDSCLLVLHDWANGLTLETEEIDAERGVISEEWRQRRDATFRVQNKIFSTLFNNSKHSKRDVIGNYDIINNFKPETIKQFYHDWYRTDLQCIVVCGDIDDKEVENKIKTLFSKIPAVENAKTRPDFEIQDNEETMFCVATDKEVQQTSISLYVRNKQNLEENINHSSLKLSIITSLFNTIVGTRINDLVREKDTPFIGATIGYGNLIRGYNAYNVTVTPKKGKEKESFKRILEINRNILKNGFDERSFLMARTNLIVSVENFYRQRNNISNELLVEYCKNNYLLNRALPSMEYDYKFFKKIINTITSKEVIEAARKWYSKENRSIVITGKEGDVYPTKQEMLDIMNHADGKNVEFKEIKSKNAKLFNVDIKGGKVVKEENLSQFGAEVWTLDNGAKIVYKYCNYSPNAVSISGTSLGGLSMVKDEDLPSASMLNTLNFAYGIGDNNYTTMRNLLTGKQVQIQANLDQFRDLVSGYSIRHDFETLLQLIYMAFEQPRFDENIHDINISRNKESLRNLKKTYNQIVSDSLAIITSSYDPRIRLNGEDYINRIEFEKVKKVYKDRFKDASDFTFYLIGDIGSRKAKQLVAKYIGSISSINRKEERRDVSADFPKGKTYKKYDLEMEEPKSGVHIVYNTRMEHTIKNTYIFNFLMESLKMRFNEEIREKEGGTYGVNVGGSREEFFKNRFTIAINFECDPSRIEYLKGRVYEEINKIVENGIPQNDYDKNLASLRKYRYNKNKDITYWYKILTKYIEKGRDIREKKYFEGVLKDLTLKDIQDFGKEYFGKADVVEIEYNPKRK